MDRSKQKMKVNTSKTCPLRRRECSFCLGKLKPIPPKVLEMLNSHSYISFINNQLVLGELASYKNYYNLQRLHAGLRGPYPRWYTYVPFEKDVHTAILKSYRKPPPIVISTYNAEVLAGNTAGPMVPLDYKPWDEILRRRNKSKKKPTSNKIVPTISVSNYSMMSQSHFKLISMKSKRVDMALSFSVRNSLLSGNMQPLSVLNLINQATVFNGMALSLRQTELLTLSRYAPLINLPTYGYTAELNIIEGEFYSTIEAHVSLTVLTIRTEKIIDYSYEIINDDYPFIYSRLENINKFKYKRGLTSIYHRCDKGLDDTFTGSHPASFGRPSSGGR